MKLTRTPLDETQKAFLEWKRLEKIEEKGRINSQKQLQAEKGKNTRLNSILRQLSHKKMDWHGVPHDLLQRRASSRRWHLQRTNQARHGQCDHPRGRTQLLPDDHQFYLSIKLFVYVPRQLSIIVISFDSLLLDRYKYNIQLLYHKNSSSAS